MSEWDHKVFTLYNEAMEQPEEDRNAYIKTRTKDNQQLHQEVVKLVQSAEAEDVDDLDAGIRDQIQEIVSAVFFEDLSGTTIGHYKFIRPIGKGATGCVYFGMDDHLRRPVALKVLHNSVKDSLMMRRFRKEGRMLALLNHPNIVTIHNMVEDGEHLFLCMELVEGRHLGELIPDGGMPFEQFKPLAVQILDALIAAHDAGVIHRDLKPANIMVNREEYIKMTDFGLARGTRPAPCDKNGAPLVSALTEKGQIMGTFPYMSPEQVSGLELDSRSDMFSLCVIFHEMLTGERPFTGSNTGELTAAIMRDKPPRLFSHNPNLPEHVQQVLDRGLSKEKDARFESVLALKNALMLPFDALSEPAQEDVQLMKQPDAKKRFGIPRGCAFSFAMKVIIAFLIASLLTVAFLGVKDHFIASDQPDVSLKFVFSQNKETVGDRPILFSSAPPPRGVDSYLLGNLLELSLRQWSPFHARFVPENDLHAHNAALLMRMDYQKKGSRNQIVLQLFDAGSDAYLGAVSHDYERSEEPHTVVGKLAVALLTELDADFIPPGDLAGNWTTAVSNESLRAYFVAGDYYEQSNHEAAQRVLGGLLDRDPNFVLAWVLQSSVANGLGDREKALEAITNAHEMQDKVFSQRERLLVQGDFAMMTYDFRYARQAFSDLVNLDPRDYEARRRLAMVYEFLGLPNDALAAHEKALQGNPQSPLYQGHYLLALVISGAPQKALDWLDKGQRGMALHPHHLWAKTAALLTLNRCEEAERSALELGRLASQEEYMNYRNIATYLLAQTRFYQGQVRQAVATLSPSIARQVALGRYDNQARSLVWLCWLNRMLQNEAAVTAGLENLLNLSPIPANLIWFKDGFELSLGFNDAMATEFRDRITEVARLYPSSYADNILRYISAERAAAAGQLDTAHITFQSMVYDRRDPASILALAQVLERKGDRDEALLRYRNVAESYKAEILALGRCPDLLLKAWLGYARLTPDPEKARQIRSQELACWSEVDVSLDYFELKQ